MMMEPYTHASMLRGMGNEAIKAFNDSVLQRLGGVTEILVEKGNTSCDAMKFEQQKET